MAHEGIPADTARFIRSYIDSVGQLEILLLLCEEAGVSLTAAQINEKLRSNIDSVERRLATLCRHGLVAHDDSTPRQYRYEPATEEMDNALRGLATIYEKFRGRVIDLIYSSPDRMKNFSDAFRLKDKDDTNV